MKALVAYPAEVRLFARGLYLQGHSLNETAKLIKAQYPSARCNAETIRRWAAKEDWDASRAEVYRNVDSKQQLDATEILESHKSLYQLMIDKGEKGLSAKGNIPRTASEAGSLIDTGIKGQRTALRDLVSLGFLKAVVQIINEEVLDDATRRRVAVRFRELAQSGELLGGITN